MLTVWGGQDLVGGAIQTLPGGPGPHPLRAAGVGYAHGSRFAHGRMAELWGVADLLCRMRQLGPVQLALIQADEAGVDVLR